MVRTKLFEAAQAAFSERDYRLFSIGLTIAYVGFWVNFVSLGWLAWELTQSATWLGIIGFADLFPALLIGPFAGAWIDRLNRLTVLKVAQLAVVGQMTVLAMLTLTGLINIYYLLLLATTQGVIIAFSQPATLALVPSLVRRRNLPAAMAVNASIAQATNFIGPPLAGLIIVGTHVGWAFVVNAVCYLIYFLFASMCRPKYKPTAVPRDRGLLEDIGEGLRYATSHRGIFVIFALVVAEGFLARPLLHLLPGFASEVFSVGAEGLSLLNTANGLGALLAAVWLSNRARVQGLTVHTLTAVWGLGIAMGLLAGTAVFHVSLLALFVFGLSTSTLFVGGQTLLQASVEEHVRGRIMGGANLLSRGAAAFGTLIAGVAADVLGLQATVAVAAVVLTATALLTSARVAAVRSSLEPDSRGQ